MDFSQRSPKDWIALANEDAATIAVPQGEELLKQIATLSGLPGEWVNEELETAIEDIGCKSSDLTLEQLRAVMLAYLDSVQKDLMPDGPEETSGEETLDDELSDR